MVVILILGIFSVDLKWPGVVMLLVAAMAIPISNSCDKTSSQWNHEKSRNARDKLPCFLASLKHFGISHLYCTWPCWLCWSWSQNLWRLWHFMTKLSNWAQAPVSFAALELLFSRAPGHCPREYQYLRLSKLELQVNNWKQLDISKTEIFQCDFWLSSSAVPVNFCHRWIVCEASIALFDCRLLELLAGMQCTTGRRVAYMEPHPTPPPRWPSWPEVGEKKLVSWSATQFSSHNGKDNYHIGTKLVTKHAKYASKTYRNNPIFYSISYMEYSVSSKEV